VHETYVVNIRPISGISCFVKSSKLREFLYKTFSYVRENTDDILLRIVMEDMLQYTSEGFVVVDNKIDETDTTVHAEFWTSTDIRKFNEITSRFTKKTVKQSWWSGTYVEIERDILAISKWLMTYGTKKTQDEELKKIYECALKMLTYEKYDFMDLVEIYNIRW